MLAPIILFVYNRLNHTEKTVEALKNNKLALQSELFVYADGAKELNDAKVNNVREYIRTIKGFKKITIIERDKNWGLANNIVDGVTSIVSKHDKVIVLEDDLVTDKGFLEYMNTALDLYKNEPKVISIHGYTYPINKKLPETFFIKGADCWGWATWKRGWDLYNSDAKELYDEIIKKNKSNEFDYDNSYAFTKMLKDQITENYSWAIKWYASAFIKNKLTLYPSKSLIKNIGFGEEATNTKTPYQDSKFIINFNSKKIKIKPIEVIENKKARALISKFFILKPKDKQLFKSNYLSRLLRKVKSIFNYIYRFNSHT